MAFDKELDICLRFRFTLMVIVTLEEEWALQMMKQVCEQTKRPCITWDLADGFQSLTQDKGNLPTAKDPLTALDQIEKADTNGLFVLKDFHDCWGNA